MRGDEVMRIISDSIGWDGSHFFCRRCGKAGYDKMAQVKGHLAMCPGRAISKGAVPQLAAASSSPVGRPKLGSLQISPAASQQQQLDNRVTQLENEYNHMLVERNRPAVDWFSQNKALIMLGVVLLIAFYMMSRESECNCETKPKNTKNALGNLGEKALSKIVDKGITKGIDRLLR